MIKKTYLLSKGVFMKKIGVILIALLVVGLAFTSCGLFNPVKNTTWEASETDSFYGIEYSYTYTLSFEAEDVVKLDLETSSTALGVSVSDSKSYSGTYEYKGGEVTATITMAGKKEQFTGTIEKDTMVVKFADDAEALTFTKVKK